MPIGNQTIQKEAVTFSIRIHLVSNQEALLNTIWDLLVVIPAIFIILVNIKYAVVQWQETENACIILRMCL